VPLTGPRMSSAGISRKLGLSMTRGAVWRKNPSMSACTKARSRTLQVERSQAVAWPGPGSLAHVGAITSTTGNSRSSRSRRPQRRVTYSCLVFLILTSICKAKSHSPRGEVGVRAGLEPERLRGRDFKAVRGQ